MAFKSHALALVFLPLLVASAVAYNVAEILADYEEFTTISKYLTETKLVEEIDKLEMATVLVVDNSAVSPLASLSAEDLKKVLSVHVILDYCDPYELTSLANKTALLATLLQTTGNAVGQTGFLNATQISKEDVVFGSAVVGSPLSSELIKVVGARPYNLSVLQVSSVILPPGIGSAAPVEASKASGSTPPTAPKDSAAASVEVPEASSVSAEAPAGASAAGSPAASPAHSAAGPRAVASAALGLVAAGAVFIAL